GLFMPGTTSESSGHFLRMSYIVAQSRSESYARECCGPRPDRRTYQTGSRCRAENDRADCVRRLPPIAEAHRSGKGPAVRTACPQCQNHCRHQGGAARGPRQGRETKKSAQELECGRLTIPPASSAITDGRKQGGMASGWMPCLWKS